MRVLGSLVVVALGACGPAAEDLGPPSPLLDVPEDRAVTLDGLQDPVMVAWTQGGVPRIYASNELDLHRVQGYLVARDRFFQMDLVRRLATGTISALLGDVGLEADIESRMTSMGFHTDLVLASFQAEDRARYTAYAEGFNDYIAAVRAGDEAAPSEYVLAAPLLGQADPAELMSPWTLRDVAAIGGTILFRLGFESGDVGRSADALALEGLFEGAALGDLRRAGAIQLFQDLRPLHAVSSAPGWGAGATRSAPARPALPVVPRVHRGALERARARLDRLQDRLGRDHEEGWGSNAWAVAGSASADGRALLAGDGHLELDIPALFYALGRDTEHLGGGGRSEVGLSLAGMPMLSVGTNGQVAWSSTQLSGDITDWYAEVVELGEDGLPARTLTPEGFRDVVRVEESFEVAEVALLGSVGRVERRLRFTTADGRWITDVEGRVLADGEEPGSGEAVLELPGVRLVPGDEDGDGRVTAISFDFTGLDGVYLLKLYEDLAKSRSVEDFHQGMRASSALSQNLMAADIYGGIYYTGYQATPCRAELRAPDGSWAEGADPNLLIDASRFHGFQLRFLADGRVDPASTTGQGCVVPFEEWPHSFGTEDGFLQTANNDPAGITFDNSFFDDPHYIGGPWTAGFRAFRISERLREETEAKTGDLEAMQAIQGDHQSQVGRLLVAPLLQVLAEVEAYDAGAEGSEGRAAAYRDRLAGRLDEVVERLRAWEAAGFPARSGVETFYAPLEAGDLEAAVATTIFNVWLGDLLRESLDDEGMPGSVWRLGGSASRLKLLVELMDSPAGENPFGHAHYDPDSGESAYWDDLRTPDRELKAEIVLRSLELALDFLASAPTAPDEGGFGTSNMESWLWGLRHQVEFDSLVAAYLDDSVLGSIFSQFAIDTERLPLAEGLTASDARSGLRWFPRHGDNRNVDAANPGLSGRTFRYASGPVMRMVFALGKDGVEGRNVLPGGQSGLTDSPHFSDQAALWLGNDSLPVPITPEEVAAEATHRTSFLPPDLASRWRPR